MSLQQGKNKKDLKKAYSKRSTRGSTSALKPIREDSVQSTEDYRADLIIEKVTTIKKEYSEEVITRKRHHDDGSYEFYSKSTKNRTFYKTYHQKEEVEGDDNESIIEDECPITSSMLEQHRSLREDIQHNNNEALSPVREGSVKSTEDTTEDLIIEKVITTKTHYTKDVIICKRHDDESGEFCKKSTKKITFFKKYQLKEELFQ